MSVRSSVFVFFCLILTVILPPASLQAQQPDKLRRIGVLISATRESLAPDLDAFRQKLHELGYIEGRNIAIEYRFAEGKLERLPDLVAELLRLQVELLVVAGGEAVSNAKKATSTIPIIMAIVQDPVGAGYVESLAHPGGNVTGLTNYGQLSGKRLELFKEAFPKVSRVAVLWQPDAQVRRSLLRIRKWRPEVWVCNSNLWKYGTLTNSTVHLTRQL